MARPISRKTGRSSFSRQLSCTSRLRKCDAMQIAGAKVGGGLLPPTECARGTARSRDSDGAAGGDTRADRRGNLAFVLVSDAVIGPRPFGKGLPKSIARPPFRSCPHAQGRLADLYFFPWHDHLVGDGSEPGRRRTLSTGGPVSPRDRRSADFDIPNQRPGGPVIRAAEAAIDENGGGQARAGGPRSDGRLALGRPHARGRRTRDRWSKSHRQ